MATTGAIDAVGFLGREFIAYVGDSDPSAIDIALADPSHPDHAKVAEAVARCERLLHEHWPYFVPELVKVPPGEAFSVANLLRRDAGGAIPDLPRGDGVLAPLARIARDALPACLLAPQLEQVSGLRTPGQRLIGSLDNHPAAPEFQKELADDALNELFAIGPAPFFSFASGIGTAVNVEGLILGLIGAAVVRARLRIETFTFETVLEELRALIDDLRAIQAGSEIRLPVVVALHGLNVEAGLHIGLPWGSLRGMDVEAQQAVGDAFIPLGALFLTTVSCAVDVSSAVEAEAPRGPTPAKLRAFNTDLEARIQQVTLI